MSLTLTEPGLPEGPRSPRTEAPILGRCPCGAPATHRLSYEIRSLVGVATRRERGCRRCVNRLAWTILADGIRKVAVAMLP